VGNTNYYAIPYPEQHDIPDGAGQMKAIADRVDEVLKTTNDTAVALDAKVTTLSRPPFVQVEQSVAQTLTTAVIIPISFDLEIFDPFSMHAPANPSRLVAPTAGYYRLTGAVSLAANASGRRGISWAVNGVIVGNSMSLPPNGTNTLLTPAPNVIVFMNANDYAELRAYQDTGANLLTIAVVNSRSFATMQFVCS
jgi:hypothetical protein